MCDRRLTKFPHCKYVTVVRKFKGVQPYRNANFFEMRDSVASGDFICVRYNETPICKIFFQNSGKKQNISSTAGFEPAIFWSVVRRVIRCATRPMVTGWDTFCSMDQELDASILLCWGFHLSKSFLSVVVITCPSHGQGRRFDPGREQGDTPFCPAKVGFPCECGETG